MSRARISQIQVSWWGLATFVIALALAPPSWAAPIASVVGVDNAPQLLSANGTRELKLADQLQPGDRVALEPGSSAMLMYGQTFVVYAVEGPAVIALSKDSVVNETSGKQVEPMKTAGLMPVSGKALDHNLGKQRIGGVRMRAGTLGDLVKKDDLSEEFKRFPAASLDKEVAERALQFDKHSAQAAADVLAADLSAPNYAGKYVLVESACGNDCVRPVLVDLAEARVRALGIRWSSQEELRYRVDSTLLRLDGPPGIRRYVLEGESLRRL